MTTNEPYTPTTADIVSALDEWAWRNRGQHPELLALDADAAVARWLAGERHRVATEIAARLDAAESDEYDTGEDDSSYEYKVWSEGQGAERIFATTPGDFIRAAFPAVGGSTPAVDGEEGDGEFLYFGNDGKPVYTSPAVSDSLPLDPEAYTCRDRFKRHERPEQCPDDAFFDPRPGFSRDESRYRGDPTSTESRTA